MPKNHTKFQPSPSKRLEEFQYTSKDPKALRGPLRVFKWLPGDLLSTLGRCHTGSSINMYLLKN